MTHPGHLLSSEHRLKTIVLLVFYTVKLEIISYVVDAQEAFSRKLLGYWNIPGSGCYSSSPLSQLENINESDSRPKRRGADQISIVKASVNRTFYKRLFSTNFQTFSQLEAYCLSIRHLFTKPQTVSHALMYRPDPPLFPVPEGTITYGVSPLLFPEPPGTVRPRPYAPAPPHTPQNLQTKPPPLRPIHNIRDDYQPDLRRQTPTPVGSTRDLQHLKQEISAKPSVNSAEISKPHALLLHCPYPLTSTTPSQA